VEYAGLVPINPDGAISQVHWSGGPAGTVTRAGRNSEFSLTVPTFADRRRPGRPESPARLSRRPVGQVSNLSEKCANEPIEERRARSMSSRILRAAPAACSRPLARGGRGGRVKM
jgi:hypothetical protein